MIERRAGRQRAARQRRQLAALNAGFTSLASTAAVSFVNCGGDLGAVFKEQGSSAQGNATALGANAIGAVLGELAAAWYDPNGKRPRAETEAFAAIVGGFGRVLAGDESGIPMTAQPTGKVAVAHHTHEK